MFIIHESVEIWKTHHLSGILYHLHDGIIVQQCKLIIWLILHHLGNEVFANLHTENQGF